MKFGPALDELGLLDVQRDSVLVRQAPSHTDQRSPSLPVVLDDLLRPTREPHGHSREGVADRSRLQHVG